MADDMTLIDPDRHEGDHRRITRQLLDLLDEHQEVGRLLQASIREANEKNPHQETNPVDDVGDYVRFVDRAADLVPRDVLEGTEHPTRDDLMQAICYFYFLIDQPLDELERRGLYNPALQYYDPFADWVREFADSWGAFLGTEASWNRKMYRQFYAHPEFGLQKDWYEPASFWNTFNDFFSRYLRDPSVRPVDAPDDDTVVTSPADSVPKGVWDVDENSEIAVQGGITVKGITHYDVDDLLGWDSEFHGAFAGGTLTHTFLSLHDYHRYHFPIDGVVREVNKVQENAALQVAWNENKGAYEAFDSTGWQFAQTRGSVVVENETCGLVALIPMGMAQVSAVEFEDNVTPGTRFRKGDMLGNFLFGGSDFVMLFQEGAEFELTARKGDHHLMGEAYGAVSET